MLDQVEGDEERVRNQGCRQRSGGRGETGRVVEGVVGVS